MKRRTTPFTLIELLVVIGIIAILAGILLPTISIAIRKANVGKAKTEMSSLITAISMYQSEYDVMPFLFSNPRANQSDSRLLPNDEYTVFVSFMSQTGTSKSEANPRKVKFLEVQKVGLFNDPWGNPYRIVYDSDYSGEVEFGLAPSLVAKGSETTIPRPILIYSTGPDGKTHATADDDDNKDNVYSIETVWDKSLGHVIQ
ncbi:MAG: prepilin-type N-terminal cleavage/methylation domain-containing protein [Lentisphaeria bacterium]|jgi:prepilin-type N-terminal cleavage/methylation domain-containing protein|nr:prepilin-type N-terminal cleavage/methylation domain-containing protein [Lentisphaeria bacterium]